MSVETEFIIGPQVAPTGSWFDTTAFDRGLVHGAAFPATPPVHQLTGTVAMVNGSATVTGTGTHFLSELPAPFNQHNFWIRSEDGVLRPHYIASVTDDTHLQMTAAWGKTSEDWDQPTQSGREALTATGDDLNAYTNQNYYDQGLVQYINFARTSDVRFQTYARKITDSWWKIPAIDEGRTPYEQSMAPRVVSLAGLMLRALDGRPEMWPWLLSYVRGVYDNWIGLRITYPNLYFGARDPGYALLHTANLAAVHPDPAVRTELRDKALNGAVNYFARVQKPDGSWRWGDDAWIGEAMQPFHVGILLEGMIAVHKLTLNETVKQSIIKGAESLYRDGYNPNGWRGTYYQKWGSWSNGQDCTAGCGAAGSPFPPVATDQIAEARQLNATSIHALGYAYFLTADPKFKTMGDEMFDATYSGSDGYRGLAAFREKEYDESYRAGGKYLGYTQTSVPVPPDPVPPDPTPQPPVPKPCTIGAPAVVNIPKNGSGSIAVTLVDVTGPVTVTVLGSDGQVTVSPLTWNAGPSSTVKQFSIKVKKQSRTITFQSPCGSVAVKVNVV